ncbi:MAG: SIMPL domain-containing protein [Candidatus Cloacimonetes bacterium]|nr:SIMPL domain-containing protein [Candidatus Cloacimonadota bacterium]
MPTYLWWTIGLVLIISSDWLISGKDKTVSKTWGIAGLSFIIGLSILGVFLVQSRQSETSMRVVGYASKLFESDLVKWNLTVQRNSSPDALKEGYTRMSGDVNAFKEYLIQKGIPEKDINIQPITSFPQNDNYGNLTSYNLNQSVFILSSDLKKIEELALNPEFFANRGLLLQNSNLAYLYTKLPELKQQLLSEATSDAVARAKEISLSAKTKLGKMREARAGVFQITEPYSTDVSDYGYYNTSTRNKSISVTLTAVFKLK